MSLSFLVLDPTKFSRVRGLARTILSVWKLFPIPTHPGLGPAHSLSVFGPRLPWASPSPSRSTPAARGAAALDPGKVPGASAEMPGSDTALTVDRTYSDPGRHHHCKRRVRVAVVVAVGAPSQGRGWVGVGSCWNDLALRVSPAPSLPSLRLGARTSLHLSG